MSRAFSQGDRQAARLAAQRAAVRRRQPALLAADRTGRAAPPRAEGADLLHAAGGGSVSRRPRRGTPAGVDGADSRAAKHVDLFLPVSEYYRDFMPGYLGVPARRCGWCRSASTWRAHSAAGAPRRRVHRRLSRADRAGEGPPRSVRSLPRSAPARAPGASRLIAAGYLAPEHQPYLDEIQRKMREWGLGHEFQYRGEVDRAEKTAFLQSWTCFRYPRPTTSRRAVPARGAGEWRTGGAAAARRVSRDRVEDRRRPAGRRPTSCGARGGILAFWRDPEQAAALGGAGARGVREHYDVGVMAERPSRPTGPRTHAR